MQSVDFITDFSKKPLIIAVSAILVSEGVKYLIRRINDSNGKKEKKEKKEIIAEALFFSSTSLQCHKTFNFGKQTCDHSDCTYSKIKRMIHYLNKAKKSLNICIYLFSYKDLAEAVVAVHKRGVPVRIIFDSSMADHPDSQFYSFKQKGIQILLNNGGDSYLMHHKFAIIDGETLLSGSINWTGQGLVRNYENMIITNQEQFVKPFVDEFEKLWAILQKGEKLRVTKLQRKKELYLR